ncbi:MAG: ABC transporter substrate-binding protein [Synergistaceae bacterium]|jgi:simple sugar transport system substrate-binding protein|nr:ABC transporter substrate-binding protein [Synergistaceae bacterium]
MKQKCALLLVLVSVLVVAFGCAAFAAEKKIVVGFAQIGAESDWRVANTNSIIKACEEAGIELRFVDGQQKQENQIKALRDFITQGVDVIGFAPVVESGWDEVIEEINDAGIPLILSDRTTDIEGTDYYVTWMGSNFIEEGEKAGNWLVEYLAKNGRDKDQINIVELQGTVGSGPAIDRKKGFENILAKHPNLKITQSQTGDFTRDLGRTVMESFLKKGEKIDVLYAHNDDMALGASQAIKEAGLKPGSDIIIIGVDAVKGAFEAMVAGEMNVTVECSPLLGPQFVEAVKKIVAGESLPKITYSIEGVYPQEVAKDVIDSRQY